MTVVEAIQAELKRWYNCGDGFADGAQRIVLALADAGFVVVSDASEPADVEGNAA